MQQFSPAILKIIKIYGIGMLKFDYQAPQTGVLMNDWITLRIITP